MPASELGKLIYDFLAQQYGTTFTEVSCDEDYCTIHVQTSSVELNTIIIKDGD
jgi:hypothetical protein